MFNIKMPSAKFMQYGLVGVGSALLLSWLHIRPLGIFFLAIFSLWFYKTKCNLRIVPPPELQKKLEQIIERFRSLRETNPKMFCAVSSGCLGTLAILGHLISGSMVMLLGLVLAAILSTKYNFKFIRIEHKDFDWSEKLNHDPELDDEFMPEVNESNICVLERASDLATLSSPTEDAEEEKSDEIPSELLIPDLIPEIDENYTDEDDDDDLVPIVRNDAKAANISYNPAIDPKQIEFKKGHFKRDSSLSTTSSSSDEENLCKGLKFPDYTAVDGSLRERQLMPSPSLLSQLPPNADASDVVALAVKSQTQTLLANSGKLLPSLMSSLVQWGTGGAASSGSALNTAATGISSATETAQKRVVTALDSSDESDFEILENDEFI